MQHNDYSYYSYVQYLVINYKMKEFEKEHVYIHIHIYIYIYN